MTDLITRSRAFAERASPGPWEVNGDHFLVCSTGNSSEDGNDYYVSMNGYAARDGLGESDAKSDAEFIAASRELVPQLCDALELAIGALEDECSCCNDEWTGEKVMCDPCLALQKLRGEG